MKTISTFACSLVLCAACAGAPPQTVAPEHDAQNAQGGADSMAPPEQPAREPQKEEAPQSPEVAKEEPDDEDPYAVYQDVRELPDNALGKKIEAFIAVVNSNDPEKMKSFAKEAFTDEFYKMVPLEVHLAFASSIYYETRGVEFYGKREYQGKIRPGENVFILRSKATGQWCGLTVFLEPQPPHRISDLNFGPARPPHDEVKLRDLSQKEIVDRLRRYVEKLAKIDLFSGAVLLAKDGKVLFKRAYGEASKGFGVKNRVDTKFNLGSMNKMFTGVAVAQLVEQNKLSFDDPLSKFISEDWMPKAVSDKIKIKHLLTHTSGLGSYFNETFINSSRLLFRKLEDYKKLVRVEELPFEPGTRFQYSNTGMFMLGVVIEKVSGQSYFDYVREHIYEPAGMKNTDCYEMDRPVPNLAIGYTRDAQGWRNNLYDHVIKGAAAGGGFSTVEDLLAFDIALRNHKLLSTEMTNTVLTPKPELKSPEYGFGFGVTGEPTDRRVGHGGGFLGIRANLDMYLDSGYTAVVLSNYDVGADAVVAKMRELIAARREK